MLGLHSTHPFLRHLSVAGVRPRRILLVPVRSSQLRQRYFVLYRCPSGAVLPQSAIEFLSDTTSDMARCNTASVSSMTETHTRHHLGDFGLDKDLALRRVNTLSAGQHVRLWLARELLRHPKPALLFLDEMSENVDIQTLSSLLEMLLDHFEGAVLAISHDPDFCDSFSCTKNGTCGGTECK